MQDYTIYVLDGVSTSSPLIPQLLYSFFQMEFACVTLGFIFVHVSLIFIAFIPFTHHPAASTLAYSDLTNRQPFSWVH